MSHPSFVFARYTGAFSPQGLIIHMKKLTLGLITAGACLFTGSAFAHVSVTSAPHFANAYSEFTFAVPHGCAGLNSAGQEQNFDSQKVEVKVDKSYGLSGLRPLNSVYGDVEISEDDTTITLTWTKKGELYDSDTHAYNLQFRAKTPDTPFTTIYFPAIQHCISDTGEALTAEWVGMGAHDHHGDSTVKPAPKITLNPKRYPGWNLYTVTQDMHDLSAFSDAQIVWNADKTAAWSANPLTQQMIMEDDTIGELEMLSAGSQVWVKY